MPRSAVGRGASCRRARPPAVIWRASPGRQPRPLPVRHIPGSARRPASPGPQNHIPAPGGPRLGIASGSRRQDDQAPDLRSASRSSLIVWTSVSLSGRRRDGASRLSRPGLIPAIPTTGLAWSGGIIPAVRIKGTPSVWFCGRRVSTRYVPNIGMARTIGQILVIQLLGHRRTCHTSQTGPMVRLSPATGMI